MHTILTLLVFITTLRVGYSYFIDEHNETEKLEYLIKVT